MSEKLKGLRKKRRRVVAAMRAITEAAEKEKRAATDEELTKHDELLPSKIGCAARFRPRNGRSN